MSALYPLKTPMAKPLAPLTIAFMSLVHRRIQKIQLTAHYHALAVAEYAHAGPTAWVSNEKDNTITIIDIETLEAVDTIEVGQRPRGIIFSKDFSKLYICASDDDTVQVMDPETKKIS